MLCLDKINSKNSKKVLILSVYARARSVSMSRTLKHVRLVKCINFDCMVVLFLHIIIPEFYREYDAKQNVLFYQLGKNKSHCICFKILKYNRILNKARAFSNYSSEIIYSK